MLELRQLWGGERRTDGRARIYDERKPLEPKYPSVRPSVADFVVGEEAGKHDIEEVKLLHAPPRYSLILNAPDGDPG